MNDDLLRQMLQAGAEIELRMRQNAAQIIDTMPDGNAYEALIALACALGTWGQLLMDDGMDQATIQMATENALHSGQLYVQESRPKKSRRRSKRKGQLNKSAALKAAEDLLRGEG